MSRTAEEQQAFEDGRAAGATNEQISTLFRKVDAIEAGQAVIMQKIDGLNSFKMWAMGAAAAVSFIVSTGWHFVKELFK